MHWIGAIAHAIPALIKSQEFACGGVRQVEEDRLEQRGWVHKTGPVSPTWRHCKHVQCFLLPYCQVQRLEPSSIMSTNSCTPIGLTVSFAWSLFTVISAIQRPQLNDYSFIYFQLFTDTLFFFSPLLITATLSCIAGGVEREAAGLLMNSERRMSL